MSYAIEAILLVVLLSTVTPLLLAAAASGHAGLGGALNWLGDCWFVLRMGEGALLLVLLSAVAPGSLATSRMLYTVTTRWIRSARLRHELRDAAPPPELCRLARALGLGRLVYVDRPEAFAFARFSDIVVSRGLVELLPGEELKAVLLHEQHHLRRRCARRALWVGGLGASTAFIPVVPLLLRAWWLREELDADRAASAVGGEVVAAALLRLARRAQPLQTVPGTASDVTPHAFDARGPTLGPRVRALLGERVPLFDRDAWRPALLRSVFILAVLTLAPALLHEAPLEWHLRDWLPHDPGRSC